MRRRSTCWRCLGAVMFAVVGFLMLAAPRAQADWHGRGGWHGGGEGWHGGGRGWHGGGWGPGPFLGGLAAGAIIGGALASPYYYPYPYGYYGPPPYPYYGGGAGCAWQRVWNGYAWVRACI